MVKGNHADHHDTAIFPYSYLMEKEGRSHLLPGANLTSYGTVRDLEKWPARDRRTVGRDVINFEEHNPCVTGTMLRAVDTLHMLRDQDPAAGQYAYGKTVVRATALQRGIKLYDKAIVAALGAMLDGGTPDPRYDGTGRWIDVAGQYITKRETEAIADDIETGALRTLEEIDNRFRVFHVHYGTYARSWAEQIYASLLGHTPTAEEIREAIEAGRNAHAAMRRTTDADRDRDCSLALAVSYGADSEDETEIRADYRAVRGLE